jgi:hypothetical protein
MKLNHPNTLPPVGCPLVIKVKGELIRAERTAHIEAKSRDMTYRTEAGVITGRFEWTYP